MPIFIDQMKRAVAIPTAPKRIISLVPSQTELLKDLGLTSEVVGITKFCVHPNDWLINKTRVGGTKNVNFETIEKLQPDLIIANKEENSQEDILKLEKNYPVWISDIIDLNDALLMIKEVGVITNRIEAAMHLSEKIRIQFEALEKLMEGKQKRRVAYFIWNKPMMAAGTDNFINDMLRRCCLENIFEQSSYFNEQKQSVRYPVIQANELSTAAPDLILLSSEPFPFREKHIQAFKAICPLAEIKIVDGEMFSWYGSRLQFSADYFKTVI
jgi:ABC-type Fe3+-hydroxamate transport system substrate-binding protein